MYLIHIVSQWIKHGSLNFHKFLTIPSWIDITGTLSVSANKIPTRSENNEAQLRTDEKNTGRSWNNYRCSRRGF